MSQLGSKRTRTESENTEEQACIISERCNLYNSVYSEFKEETDPLFAFNFNDAPDNLLIKYRFYFDKLCDFEKNIHMLKAERLKRDKEEILMQEQAQEQQRVESLKQEFSRGLDIFYPTGIISSLLNNLPDAIFQTEKPVIPSENLKYAVQTVFPNISETNAKLECQRIWEIIYGNSQSELKDSDDTPDFVVDENNVLVIKKSCSEFYPFKHLYVRDCYIKLYPKLVESAKNTVVALIGDPGIGKSSFLRYVYANIVGNRNISPRQQPQKVFWIMESGFWRYFDGTNRFSGSGKFDSDLWIDPEVLLLIDGAFRNEHLHRTRNVILFCSPQHQNYEKMIKASCGAIFVMPAWDLTEVEKFIDLEIEIEIDTEVNLSGDGNRNRETIPSTGTVVKENILCQIMKVFYDRMCLQARTEVRQPIDIAIVEEEAENPNEIEINDQSVLNYNEFEAVNNLPQVQFLKNEVINRFFIVGGKIRLLLHNEISFSLLKGQVLKSINAVSVEKLKELDSMDIHGDTPSIIYSLDPKSYLTDSVVEYFYREYCLCFTTRFVSTNVASRIAINFENNVRRLFAAMKDQKIGGSLIGQLFESLMIGAIISFKAQRLIGKNLEIENSPVNLRLTFGDFDIKKYDSSKTLLQDYILLSSTRNRFLIPIQLNAPAVDAIFVDVTKQKVYFFQITVSSLHPVQYKYLVRLARAFEISHENIELVYLVPKDCCSEFKKQNFMVGKRKMNGAYIGFKQSVMYVAGNAILTDNTSLLNLI